MYAQQLVFSVLLPGGRPVGNHAVKRTAERRRSEEDGSCGDGGGSLFARFQPAVCGRV